MYIVLYCNGIANTINKVNLTNLQKHRIFIDYLIIDKH